MPYLGEGAYSITPFLRITFRTDGSRIHRAARRARLFSIGYTATQRKFPQRHNSYCNPRAVAVASRLPCLPRSLEGSFEGSPARQRTASRREAHASLGEKSHTPPCHTRRWTRSQMKKKAAQFARPLVNFRFESVQTPTVLPATSGRQTSCPTQPRRTHLWPRYPGL